MTTTKRYRKRPVTIEAVALTPKNVREVATWCGGRVVEEGKPSDPSDVYLGLDIPTLEATSCKRGGPCCRRDADSSRAIMGVPPHRAVSSSVVPHGTHGGAVDELRCGPPPPHGPIMARNPS